MQKTYNSVRHELESPDGLSGALLSKENADGVWAVAGVDKVSSKRGRLLAEPWLEEGGEKGGEGDGDSENEYFWLPGPTLMGRGDGGVGGDDDGEMYPLFFIT